MQRLTLLLVLLAGCAGSSRYMTKDETPDAIEPQAGQALIVFVRPSGAAYAMEFSVIDDKGNYIGQVPAKGHVLHAAAPGRHTYIVWAENTAVLDAEVAAGKTYIVEVAPRMGMWAARAHLLPVKRGSEDWDEAMEWVKETAQWDVDPALAKQWKDHKREGLEKQLQRAKEMWAKYDDEDKEKRTMRPADGR
jgi:hypothetical protein